jgi:hypothetical protein
MYNKVRGKIMFVNPHAFELANDAFALFKELYDTHYGTIFESDNLISIHTGGWSDNEQLIQEFKETGWWKKNHRITMGGGHYYFDTDFHADKKWKIIIE